MEDDEHRGASGRNQHGLVFMGGDREEASSTTSEPGQGGWSFVVRKDTACRRPKYYLNGAPVAPSSLRHPHERHAESPADGPEEVTRGYDRAASGSDRVAERRVAGGLEDPPFKQLVEGEASLPSLGTRGQERRALLLEPADGELRPCWSSRRIL